MSIAFAARSASSRRIAHDGPGLVREPPRPPDPVDRAVARRRRDPGARVVGDPVGGPALQRHEVGVGDGLLGEVEVAQDPDERRERPAVVLAERERDRVAGVGRGEAPLRRAPGSASPRPSRCVPRGSGRPRRSRRRGRRPRSGSTGEVLLGLRERAVGDDPPPVAYRHRVAVVTSWSASPPSSIPLSDSQPEYRGTPRSWRGRPRRSGDEVRGLQVDQQQVPHWLSSSGCRPATPGPCILATIGPAGIDIRQAVTGSDAKRPRPSGIAAPSPAARGGRLGLEQRARSWRSRGRPCPRAWAASGRIPSRSRGLGLAEPELDRASRRRAAVVEDLAVDDLGHARAPAPARGGQVVVRAGSRGSPRRSRPGRGCSG